MSYLIHVDRLCNMSREKNDFGPALWKRYPYLAFFTVILEQCAGVVGSQLIQLENTELVGGKGDICNSWSKMNFSAEKSGFVTTLWASTSIHLQAGQVWVIYGKDILESAWACQSGDSPRKESLRKIMMQIIKFYYIYAEFESHGN